jgi:hypothetical protein
MIEVFKILDAFIFRDKGILLTGITKDESLRILDGQNVVIRASDGGEVNKVSLGFELMRNCWSPHKLRNMALLVKDEGENPSKYLKSRVLLNV